LLPNCSGIGVTTVTVAVPAMPLAQW